MNMLQAIEMLSAPPEIRFNLLAQERWLKSRDRKIRLAKLLTFANLATTARHGEMKAYLDREKLNVDLGRKAVESLENAKIYPNLNGQINGEKAKEACTEAFNAGYVTALRDRIGTNNEEEAKFVAKGAALELVTKEILTIRDYLNANALLDGKGNIMVDPDGVPL